MVSFLSSRERADVHRTSAFDGFDPASQPTAKERGISLSLLLGAGDRDRTGTLFTARDFKSLVSACSTTPAANRNNTMFFRARQVAWGMCGAKFQNRYCKFGKTVI